MDVAREEDEVAAADERRRESIRSHETIAVQATSDSVKELHQRIYFTATRSLSKKAEGRYKDRISHVSEAESW